MSNPISKRAVSDYVEIQAREKVHHAERVMTEHVLGHDHDGWDVHTDKDRYWVITSPTNLLLTALLPQSRWVLAEELHARGKLELEEGFIDARPTAQGRDLHIHREKVCEEEVSERSGAKNVCRVAR